VIEAQLTIPNITPDHTHARTFARDSEFKGTSGGSAAVYCYSSGGPATCVAAQRTRSVSFLRFNSPGVDKGQAI
jgi:hypothetical protein